MSTKYRAHSHEDSTFRLDAARGAFYSQKSYYGARCAPINANFKRCTKRIQPQILHGGENITLDGSSLEDMHRFEGQCLLQI
eukprot:8408117-Pyramimonas_sp.AAC.1